MFFSIHVLIFMQTRKISTFTYKIKSNNEIHPKIPRQLLIILHSKSMIRIRSNLHKRKKKKIHRKNLTPLAMSSLEIFMDFM